MSKPLVSICCTTFNHESYIADALEGFVNQKTNFHYEVLIHDDASTDRTAEIIKEFELKYPNLVKPIYQDVNQYSKGIQINRTFNYSRALGKYIALCEGDDYWIDSLKLQRQINYMKANPECTFCFTNAKIIDVQQQKESRIFIPYSKENEKYYYDENSSYDVGKLALLGFIPTATFMFRKSILENPPDFYLRKYPGGDLKLKLYATSQGYAHFINEVTSVYRTNVLGSTMSRWKKYNKDQLYSHNKGYINLINAVNKYTNYVYSSDFDKLKVGFEASQLLIKGDKELLINKKYTKWLRQQNFFHRIKIKFSIYQPKVYNFLKRINKR